MSLEDLIEKLIKFYDVFQLTEPRYRNQLTNFFYLKQGMRGALAKLFIVDGLSKGFLTNNLFATLENIKKWKGTEHLTDHEKNNIKNLFILISNCLENPDFTATTQQFGNQVLKQHFSLTSPLYMGEVLDVLTRLRKQNQYILLTTNANRYVVVSTEQGWIFYNPRRPGERKSYKRLHALVNQLFDGDGCTNNDCIPLSLRYLSFNGNESYPSIAEVLESIPLAKTKPVEKRVSELEGWTGLHMAAYVDCKESLKFLLNKGAYPNIPDAFGYLPLWYVHCYDSYDCAKLLVKYNSRAQGNVQSTPLLKYAIKKGKLDFLKSYDAQVEDIKFNADKEVLLCVAAEYNQSEVVAYLIAKKVNLEVYDEDGYTPLITAIVGRSLRSFELLLQAGAQLDRRANNKSQYAPIVYIAMTGQVEFLKPLLEKLNSALNYRTQIGTTPLMVAAFCGKKAMVEELLRLGADSYTVNHDGYTALDFAKERGHLDVITILQGSMDSAQGSAESRKRSPSPSVVAGRSASKAPRSETDAQLITDVGICVSWAPVKVESLLDEDLVATAEKSVYRQLLF